jgi:predicted transcriptional regulator
MKVSNQTVRKWYDSGYLPGNIVDNNTRDLLVPENSLRPYNPRAIRDKSIYESILRACKKHCSVFPSMYKLNEERFTQYLDELKRNKHIKEYITGDGLTQYILTQTGESFLNNKRNKKWENICLLIDALSPDMKI